MSVDPNITAVQPEKLHPNGVHVHGWDVTAAKQPILNTSQLDQYVYILTTVILCYVICNVLLLYVMCYCYVLYEGYMLCYIRYVICLVDNYYYYDCYYHYYYACYLSLLL